MFYISQILSNDCGFACLKTLLANLFKKEDYLYIPQDEEHGPYNYLELIGIAKKYGVTLKGVQMEDDNQEKLPPSPFLASLIVDESLHMVYVHKIGRRRVKFYDPAQGFRNVSLKAFLSIWDKTALVVESFKEKDELLNRFIECSTKERIILYLFEIISLVSLFVGVMLIEKNTHIYIPVICISLFAIMEILLQRYLVKLMTRFDERYLSHLNKQVPKNPKDFIYRLQNFKKMVFSGPLEVVSNTFIVVAIVVVLILNNKYNLIPIIMVVLLLLFEYLWISPYEKKRARNVFLKESDLNNAHSGEVFANNVHLLNDESYKLATFKISIKYLSYFLIFISVFVSMLFTKVTSVPYILVYGLFGVTLFEKSLKIMHYPDEIEEGKRCKTRLINLIKDILP